MPRLKPPYFPAAIGLYGQPTIVNNVETLANLPWMIVNGAAEYTTIGSETSPGTRMFAVSGHVERPGVFEIVNGTTTFRVLLYATSSAGGSVTAASSRRSSPAGLGAVVLRRALDLPFEGKLVGAAGSMLGSGRDHGDGPDHRHPAGRADAVRFYAHECCGKCMPCREGTTWLERILDADRRRPRPREDLDRCSRSASRSAPACSRTRRASGSASRPCRSRTR